MILISASLKSYYAACYGREMAFVMLVDGCWEAYKERVFLLVLLDLSVAFDTINKGTFLGCLCGMGFDGIVFKWL